MTCLLPWTLFITSRLGVGVSSIKRTYLCSAWAPPSESQSGFAQCWAHSSSAWRSSYARMFLSETMILCNKNLQKVEKNELLSQLVLFRWKHTHTQSHANLFTLTHTHTHIFLDNLSFTVTAVWFLNRFKVQMAWHVAPIWVNRMNLTATAIVKSKLLLTPLRPVFLAWLMLEI